MSALSVFFCFFCFFSPVTPPFSPEKPTLLLERLIRPQSEIVFSEVRGHGQLKPAGTHSRTLTLHCYIL